MVGFPHWRRRRPNLHFSALVSRHITLRRPAHRHPRYSPGSACCAPRIGCREVQQWSSSRRRRTSPPSAGSPLRRFCSRSSGSSSSSLSNPDFLRPRFADCATQVVVCLTPPPTKKALTKDLSIALADTNTRSILLSSSGRRPGAGGASTSTSSTSTSTNSNSNSRSDETASPREAVLFLQLLQLLKGHHQRRLPC